MTLELLYSGVDAGMKVMQWTALGIDNVRLDEAMKLLAAIVRYMSVSDNSKW